MPATPTKLKDRILDALRPTSVWRSLASRESLLDRILEKAWPSYALVALLQMKILWNMWRFRDLTTGDTSSYFFSANRWYESFADNIVWSPLYTSFYGTVLMLTGGDVYGATIFHRIIIVMAATIGVLALMRRLLPPDLALLIAIWWAVMPINFETLYEVHLFALLPVLAAWLVAAAADIPTTRGTALAILLAASVLVRNELLIASALFALICIVRERNNLPHGDTAATNRRDLIVGYGVPIVIATGVCAFFYWRSWVKYPAILDVSSSKHTLNMCQVYAFGYAQRHPEWTLSPWVECYGLMQTLFGQRLPSLWQMLQSNASATFEHFLWNLSLLPNGLQVSLFNAMSGTVNPDYAPVRRSWVALALGLAVLLIVAYGLVTAVRRWDYWWPRWFRDRMGVWLIMLAVLCVSAPVILTQRPRPSYLFAATVVLMAIIGSAVYILSYRRAILTKILAVTCGIVLLVAIPPYYKERRSTRPLYTNYQRLLPFADLMRGRAGKILIGDYAGELENYLLLRRPGMRTFDYSILSSWERQHQPLHQYLNQQNIDVVFIQPRILNELRTLSQARELLDRPEAFGWRKLGPANPQDRDWLLLQRETSKPG